MLRFISELADFVQDLKLFNDLKNIFLYLKK